MGYTTSSQLEREARSKGDPITWRAYFQSLRDDAAIVRAKCYAVLQENPEGAKQAALEKLVAKGGIWFERDTASDGFLHIHGVRHLTGNDTKPHTLSWQLSYFEHPQADVSSLDGHACEFTQETLQRILNGTDLDAPSTKQIDATWRALYTARIHNAQTELRQFAQRMIVADATPYIQTSTRILLYDPARPELIHGYTGKHPETIECDLSGPVFQSLQELPKTLRTTIRQHVLGTTETAAEIIERYNSLRVHTGGFNVFCVTGEDIQEGRTQELTVSLSTGPVPTGSMTLLMRSADLSTRTRLVKTTPIQTL